MSSGQRQIQTARLSRRDETAFDIAPEREELDALAHELGLLSLRKFRFKGRILPVGDTDLRLEADLGATVTQPCVVTLAPVRTRIDTKVERTYVADFDEPPPGNEIEMPEDDTVEPLAPTIDLLAVAFEALSLELPAYPRAPEAALEEAQFTEPGKAPLKDADLNPFAGLRDKLSGDSE